MLYVNQHSDHSEYTDEQIIKGCLNGKVHFQKVLYDKFSGKMYAVCLRYHPEPSTAEDMLQDSFIKVYLNIHKFRMDGSFEGWIRRIVINTCVEAYRKSVHMYAINEMEPNRIEYKTHNVLEQLQASDVMKLVQSLSEGYRIVFNMYVIEGYTHQEIAEHLGITVGTSKSQLSRARVVLQEMIKNVQAENLPAANQ